MPEQQPERNPASDHTKTAQERLDALARQHEEMRRDPTGTYPIPEPEKEDQE